MWFCLAQTQHSVITLLGSLVLYCTERSRRNMSATAEHQSRTSWIREYGTRTDLSSHLTLSLSLYAYSYIAVKGGKGPKALSAIPLLIKAPLPHISEVRSPGTPIQSCIFGCNNCSRRNTQSSGCHMMIKRASIITPKASSNQSLEVLKLLNVVSIGSC